MIFQVYLLEIDRNSSRIREMATWAKNSDIADVAGALSNRDDDLAPYHFAEVGDKVRRARTRIGSDATEVHIFDFEIVVDAVLRALAANA